MAGRLKPATNALILAVPTNLQDKPKMRFISTCIAIAASLTILGTACAEQTAAPFTGAYAGIALGQQNVDASWKTTSVGAIAAQPADIPDNPGSFGTRKLDPSVTVGYDWAIFPDWRLGFVLGKNWNRHVRKNTSGIPGTNPGPGTEDFSQVATNGDMSLRARLGVLLTPSTMVYATAGMARQKVDMSVGCNDIILATWCSAIVLGFRGDSTSKTMTGNVVGIGVEQALWKNWRFKAEYRNTDYGKFSHRFFPTVAGGSDIVDMNMRIRQETYSLGLTYGF